MNANELFGWVRSQWLGGLEIKPEEYWAHLFMMWVSGRNQTEDIFLGYTQNMCFVLSVPKMVKPYEFDFGALTVDAALFLKFFKSLFPSAYLKLDIPASILYMYYECEKPFGKYVKETPKVGVATPSYLPSNYLDLSSVRELCISGASSLTSSFDTDISSHHKDIFFAMGHTEKLRILNLTSSVMCGAFHDAHDELLPYQQGLIRSLFSFNSPCDVVHFRDGFNLSPSSLPSLLNECLGEENYQSWALKSIQFTCFEDVVMFDQNDNLSRDFCDTIEMIDFSEVGNADEYIDSGCFNEIFSGALDYTSERGRVTFPSLRTIVLPKSSATPEHVEGIMEGYRRLGYDVFVGSKHSEYKRKLVEELVVKHEQNPTPETTTQLKLM